MRYLIIGVLAVTCISCGGGSSSPTAPTPAPTPAPAPAAPAPTPSTVSLTGVVTYTGTSVRLEGATIRILDGPNANRTTVTTSAGAYRFDELAVGNANLSATATGWEESRVGVYIDGTNTLNFSIRSVSPWSRSGTGNNVFDKPLWVARTRIVGVYTGSSSNFIVRCGSSLVVNELIGTSWSTGTRYDGTHSTAACSEIRVENSTGVAWSMSEVR